MISHTLPQSAAQSFLSLSISIKGLSLAQMLYYLIGRAPQAVHFWMIILQHTFVIVSEMAKSQVILITWEMQTFLRSGLPGAL